MTMAPYFLDVTIGESMDYSPEFQVFNANSNLSQFPSSLPFDKILADIIHVGFHVDFSFIDDVMGCDSKLPSCKPKVGTCDNSQPMRVQGFSGAMV